MLQDISERQHAEEALRKLMVPFRTRIESGQPYDEKTVFELLRQVSGYAETSQDIRFQDCITYYAELGLPLNREAEI